MAEFWDRVMEAEDRLAAGAVRKGPMRFVVCRQISAGWGHSGYPPMGEMQWADGIVSEESLTKGDWGMFHELGHNHGYGPFALPGMVEVSVNLYSFYVMQQVCGVKLETIRCMRPDDYRRHLTRYFGGTDTYDTCGDPFTKLIFYGQLVREFGWTPFETMFAEHRAAGKNQAAGGWDHVLVRFSQLVGRDLGPFFDAWRITVSPAAKEQVKDLPGWLPEPDFPAAYRAAVPGV